jgi:trans-aconitate methyltransferase
MSDETTRLYSDLAEWWPLMSAPEDYAEEAAFYSETLIRGCQYRPRTLLELGSGGGNNATHMKRHFEAVTLVDLSAGMLEHSRRLNPECEHHVGDMRTVRLGRTFDCVFVHDAVTYMTTEEDLRRTMVSALVHCAPGGAALFAPDALKETYRPGTECGGHDGEVRAMRYLEWSWDPDPDDTTCIADYVYSLREADGSVHIVHDRHLEGLFPRETWLRLLHEVGFVPEVVPFDHSELEPGTYQLFLARRTA